MKELSDKQAETLQIKTQEYAASLQQLLERALRGENIKVDVLPVAKARGFLFTRNGS